MAYSDRLADPVGIGQLQGQLLPVRADDDPLGQVAGLLLALDLELGRELVQLLTARTVMYVQLISSRKASACRPGAAGRSVVMMAGLAGLNLRRPGKLHLASQHRVRLLLRIGGVVRPAASTTPRR